MPYVTYKLVHFLGIFTMLVALAVTGAYVIRGGTWREHPHRAALVVTHSLAALLVLIGGFGMLARLGVMHGALPTWVLLKAGIWFVLCAALALAFAGRGLARAVLVALPVLGVVAAAIALYKPF